MSAKRTSEEEKKELERIANEIIKGRGSSKVKMPFFIENFNSKLQETLREKGFKGSVKAKGMGSNNFQVTVSGFKKDKDKTKAKQIQAPPKQQKYLKPQIKVPEIVITGEESVEELKAKARELSIFRDKIRNEPYVERTHLEEEVRRLTNQIEGRINEMKMSIGVKTTTEQKQPVKQETSVIKEETIAQAKARGGPKKGLKHERRFISTVEEQGMSLEFLSEMHGEAVREHEEIIKRLKEPSFKNSIIYHRMGKERFENTLKAEEERLSLLKREKQHLENLSRLKRPVSKVLPASFLQKLFRRDIKNLNKELKEKQELIAKRAMEEKELGRIAKWRKKRK